LDAHTSLFWCLVHTLGSAWAYEVWSAIAQFRASAVRSVLLRGATCHMHFQSPASGLCYVLMCCVMRYALCAMCAVLCIGIGAAN
jgi:hypothetical protein